MSQLVKTKRQANFKGFKRFGAFKGLVEQKKRCIQLVLSRFKMADVCQKRPNLHTNSSNKLRTASEHPCLIHNCWEIFH
jgi:hypothetical protein